jgi:phenylacetate-CoA ligase
MSWIQTHLILPFTQPDRCAGLAGRLRSLRKFERMPEKAQRAEQQARLQRLLQHAYDTVPYYRNQFDEAGFRPSKARVDRPLPLPVLTREQLLTAPATLLSSSFQTEDLRPAASSGMTGAPIRFHRDAEAVRDKIALKLHLDSWAGFRPGQTVMRLWGANTSLTRESNWRWRTFETVFMRQLPHGQAVVPAEVMERWRWRLEKQRPRVLYGRATILAAFAEYLQERGTRYRPRTIITTAEVLSEANRKLLTAAFKSEPYDFYGSRDVGMIAAECSEHEGLHFHPWGSFVEFEPVGESPDGTLYRLLVTDLLNYGQPFIRYDTGDCVTLTEQSCSCGRWFPMAGRIVGRLAGGTVYANGVAVPGVRLDPNVASTDSPLLPLRAPWKSRSRKMSPRMAGVMQRGVLIA